MASSCWWRPGIQLHTSIIKSAASTEIDHTRMTRNNYILYNYKLIIYKWSVDISWAMISCMTSGKPVKLGPKSHDSHLPRLPRLLDQPPQCLQPRRRARAARSPHAALPKDSGTPNHPCI
jgi:hypothetical protein